MGPIKLLKRLASALLYRPALGSLGAGSTIRLPRRLNNKARIHVGAGCFIDRSAYFNPVLAYAGRHYAPRIEIGDGVYIGACSQLHAMDAVTLEDGVVLSDHVYVSDIAHGLDPTQGPIMAQALASKGPVRIGAHTFVGFGVSILPGVTLGRHCVVGTRAVVTRDFPAYSMVAGSPARLIKRYCLDTNAWVNV